MNGFSETDGMKIILKAFFIKQITFYLNKIFNPFSLVERFERKSQIC